MYKVTFQDNGTGTIKIRTFQSLREASFFIQCIAAETANAKRMAEKKIFISLVEIDNPI